MTQSVLDAAVERAPLVADGKSGSDLERVVLADGSRLVVKHVRPGRDWIGRATHDTGRIATLWQSGLFACVPSTIDHAVIAVEPDDAGWMVVMRDVSAGLFKPGTRLSRAMSRRLLEAAAAMHVAFTNLANSLGGLCDLADLYRFLSPGGAAESGTSAGSPVPNLAVEGWRRFPDLVPPDVVAAVSAIHDDPITFAAALLEHPRTVVHGDLKVANLGMLDDRVVVLDWGDLTSVAPAAVDYAWYVAINAAAIEAAPDELLDDVRSVAGDKLDEGALRLALLGALAQLGWEKALAATDAPDRNVRERERAGLAWWTARAREAVAVWTPA